LKKNKLNEMLKSAGLSKKEFALQADISYNTTNNWNDETKPIPSWVESWLNLYIDNQSFKKLKSAIKDSGACE